MEPIDEQEKQEMRAVLEKFYGPQVRTWDVDLGVYEALGQLITKSGECTKAMHMVPRPWDLSSPLKWAKKQVRQAVVRYLRTPEGMHYVSCMHAAALGMRTVFEEARYGL